MKAIFTLLAILLLSGCASLTGSALYTYEDGKGCKFRVDSGRIVNGLTVKACDKSLEVTVDTLNQGNSAADFNALFTTFLNAAGGRVLTPAPAEEPQE